MLLENVAAAVLPAGFAAATLRTGKREHVLAEAEKHFERVLAEFADVKQSDRLLGDAAKAELFGIRDLAVGKTAPQIDGEDIDGKRFKLSDYRGKVVVLVFWGHW